jgi:hypothetical protein
MTAMRSFLEAGTDLLFIMWYSYSFGHQGSFRFSPLCFLCGQEVVQVLDNVLKAAQPSTELFLHTGLVVSELGVEVLAVGGCAHGSTEDGLDHETVVLAEGVAVGCAE